MTAEATNATHFDDLQTRGQAAFEAGQLEESIALLQRAYHWAEEHGDSRQADLAFCNLTSARISRGERDLLEPALANRLRAILVSNSDLANCWLAAYNLARAFEYRKDNKKGLFYARIALDRAEAIGRDQWLGVSHNQIGNFLLAESYFEEATNQYRRALELLPDTAENHRCLGTLNLGYCQVVRGIVPEGIRLLYQSLRALRRSRDLANLAMNHADLCYALLDLGRLNLAVRHGSAALRLAEECDARDQIKNALYLLGVVAHEAGDAKSERAYFTQLRERFYPSTPFVTDFLLNVDVRKMINLRAA